MIQDGQLGKAAGMSGVLARLHTVRYPFGAVLQKRWAVDIVVFVIPMRTYALHGILLEGVREVAPIHVARGAPIAPRDGLGLPHTHLVRRSINQNPEDDRCW